MMRATAIACFLLLVCGCDLAGVKREQDQNTSQSAGNDATSATAGDDVETIAQGDITAGDNAVIVPIAGGGAAGLLVAGFAGFWLGRRRPSQALERVMRVIEADSSAKLLKGKVRCLGGKNGDAVESHLRRVAQQIGD